MTEPVVIYEDKNFLSVNKPAGLLVHRATSDKPSSRAQAEGRQATSEPTLVDWLLKRYPEIKTVGDPSMRSGQVIHERPGIVHRLDKATSGIILIARTQRYFEYLKSLFQKHEIKKIYLALVYGKVEPKTGVIEKPIGIRNGTTKRSVHSGKMAKEAITKYKALKNFDGPRQSASSQRESATTLVEVYPKTGRTHQIRVHLASIGHPIVGDKLYGPQKPPTTCHLPPTRLMLHALSLEFTTEEGKRLKLEAEVPDEFMKILKGLVPSGVEGVH